MKKQSLFYIALVFGFLLGIHDGFIALWKDGCTDPVVFPYRAEVLPDADRRRLENGIRVEEGSKLAELLEDYLS